MPLTLYHVWTCDICGHTVRSKPRHIEHCGDISTRNFGPTAAGWNYISGKLVCPRHALTIGEEKDPETKNSFPAWKRLHRWKERFAPGCARCAAPPEQYEELVEESMRTMSVQVTGSHDEQIFDGMEVFPDPSVTEFTRR